MILYAPAKTNVMDEASYCDRLSRLEVAQTARSLMHLSCSLTCKKVQAHKK